MSISQRQQYQDQENSSQAQIKIQQDQEIKVGQIKNSILSSKYPCDSDYPDFSIALTDEANARLSEKPQNSIRAMNNFRQQQQQLQDEENKQQQVTIKIQQEDQIQSGQNLLKIRASRYIDYSLQSSSINKSQNQDLVISKQSNQSQIFETTCQKISQRNSGKNKYGEDQYSIKLQNYSQDQKQFNDSKHQNEIQIESFRNNSGSSTTQNISQQKIDTVNLSCGHECQKLNLINSISDKFFDGNKSCKDVERLFKQNDQFSLGSLYIQPQCPICSKILSFADLNLLFPNRFNRKSYVKIVQGLKKSEKCQNKRNKNQLEGLYKRNPSKFQKNNVTQQDQEYGTTQRLHQSFKNFISRQEQKYKGKDESEVSSLLEHQNNQSRYQKRQETQNQENKQDKRKWGIKAKACLWIGAAIVLGTSLSLYFYLK